ncbi:helix-turn-helix transcriptional regulator [Brachybacterium sp. GCM10030267]|uniref:helix-turn-helix transcriptional regulator n=1 Tax=unclassified Brachybacterium TaxID=2623841 RepID=UPI003620F133
MPGPSARMLRLLELLQSAQIRTVGELAELLEVDERTVRRYVAHLAEMGIEIDAVRGRYGGYRLAAGSRMPPVILDDDEAVAVILGLLRAQSSTGAPDIDAQTALAKFRRVLPAASVRRLDQLMATAVFADAPSPREGADGDAPDGSILLALADAISERQPLQMRYRNADGEPSLRTVHPYDLVARAGRWYLVALDVARGEERTFRLDRVRTARAVPGTFVAPSPRDAARRLVDGFAAADYRWLVRLRLRASRDHIRAHLPDSVAQLQPCDGDDEKNDPGDEPWSRAEIRAQHLDWLPGVIAALGCPVLIEEPEELRDLARVAAARLLRAAGDEAE